MPPVLEAQGIEKIYGAGERSVVALPEFSFVAHEGELVVITGPSGSGKSTLINILSTLDRPSAGRVLFRGNDLLGSSIYNLPELRNTAFGFIFQTPYLLQDRTVIENVGLPFLYGPPVDPNRANARCQELLDYVGLDGFAQRYPQTLSGGEMQRVVFARALVRQPEIIFADEPTGSLDAENSDKILNLLQQQAEEGCTVIMVTHDATAVAFGTRIVTLEKIQAGSKSR